VQGLLGYGEEIIVLDDKSGRNNFPMFSGVKYVNIQLHHPDAFTTLIGNFQRTKNNFVIHLAGSKSVALSTKHPELFSERNLKSTKNLLEAMAISGVEKLIFSSTAAVYGTGSNLVDESSNVNPVSNYGKVKLMEEKEIQTAGQTFLNNYAILRFFNVIGANGKSQREKLGDNIFPQIALAIENREPFRIFGNKYKTIDGTCVRDYVDVRDLVVGIKKVIEIFNGETHETFNFGTGIGTSVLQIIEEVLKIQKFEIEFVAPRAGDIPSLVSSKTKVQNNLAWSPKYSLMESIESSFGN